MSESWIHDDLVRIALDRAEGFPFERFAGSFYGSLIGANFVPLGGLKDGGADGYDGTIFQDGMRAETYYQASVAEDAEGKVKRTVQRLREFGRAPRTLTYLTSRTVKHSDRVERDLSDDLDVTIIIRDGNYFTSHTNDTVATRAAFDEHLRHYTDFLKGVGASRRIPSSSHVKSPAVYVFLAQEMERRSGDESLVNAMTDALGLWALEGTDPDKGILRSPDDVMAIIDAELPGVHALVAPRLQRRLEAMGNRSYPGGRAVRWHKAAGTFALPWTTRRRIEAENTADEALRLQVLSSLDERLRTCPIEGLGDTGIRQAAEMAMRTLELTFEREGLEFASYVASGGGQDYPTIADSLKDVLALNGVSGRHGLRVGDGAFQILRGVLYDSRDVERQYLQKLSRTYALLFTLRAEPRLLEFFQEMTGQFRLYVGADQIVRALSEHYLAEHDRMTRNTLLLAHRAGARLILTEPALEEVVGHLRAADMEHKNHVKAVEHLLTFDMARQAPHIMLRAYLYARLNSELGRRRPSDWSTFVQQFCEYRELHRSSGSDDLRKYLQVVFGFEFESTADLEDLVDLPEVQALAEDLHDVKPDSRLARNDALVALAVYGSRAKRRETAQVTEFGWATWWLTGETKILRYTTEFVRKHRARYAMRPEFLLNFLTLAPSAMQARATFAAVFPSLLGIRLSKRMHVDDFHKIMDRFQEAEQLDDARRTVEIAKAADFLKSDYRRQYIDRLPDAASAAVDLAAERVALDDSE